MDHLQLATASLVGFSMGSVVALHLLHTYPQRFGRSVLIATGDGLLGLPPHTMAETAPQLARALDRDHYPAELPKHVAMYWNFATKVGGDRLASAAAARAHYPVCMAEEAGRVAADVLVISGEIDPVLGQGPQLARSFAHGRYLEIAGADHFMLAASDEAKGAAANFLAKGA
jgi:pimeloyl-ACP methyl ester carboxylesterase